MGKRTQKLVQVSRNGSVLEDHQEGRESLENGNAMLNTDDTNINTMILNYIPLG